MPQPATDPMHTGRVLLVEDDASLRRFVSLALDEPGITLIEAAGVADALEVLRRQPVDVILTDLMMAGGSGFTLLDTLRDQPALQATAKVAVFSAGLNAEVRRKLAPYALWRLLDKPVPVATLLACVHDALAGRALQPTSNSISMSIPTSTPVTAGMPALATADASTANNTPAKVPAPTAPNPAQLRSIAEFFDGNATLYQSYSEACFAQFPSDIETGQGASNSLDMPTLERLAHSLKTVLLTLGYRAASDVARELERTARHGAADVAAAQWTHLRTVIEQIAAANPSN